MRFSDLDLYQKAALWAVYVGGRYWDRLKASDYKNNKMTKQEIDDVIKALGKIKKLYGFPSKVQTVKLNKKVKFTDWEKLLFDAAAKDITPFGKDLAWFYMGQFGRNFLI